MTEAPSQHQATAALKGRELIGARHQRPASIFDDMIWQHDQRDRARARWLAESKRLSLSTRSFSLNSLGRFTRI